MTDRVALEPIGGRIRRIRIERGLSQERLALEAHIDQSGLSKFERGKERQMGKDSLDRIAKRLNHTFESLVDGTDYVEASR